MIFGLYYNFTSFIIGFTAGLRAFTAAVLGGIGNIPGAMVGGVLIGLIEAFGGQFIATAWTDVIIFSILVLVLVFRPAGLFRHHGSQQVLGTHPVMPPCRPSDAPFCASGAHGPMGPLRSGSRKPRGPTRPRAFPIGP